MQFTFDMRQIQEEQQIMINECKSHFGCKDCKIYNGEEIQIGQSRFVCQNYGRGKQNAG